MARTVNKAEDEEIHQGLCSNPEMHRVPASRDIIGVGDVLDSACVEAVMTASVHVVCNTAHRAPSEAVSPSSPWTWIK